MGKRPQGQRGSGAGRNKTGSRDSAKGDGKGGGRGAGERPRRIEMRFPEARGDVVDAGALREQSRAQFKKAGRTGGARSGAVDPAAQAEADKASARARLLRTSTGERREASGRPTEEMRVAKAMARAGLCSRRDAERWIGEGRVKVNGQTITSPALDVGPRDKIMVDGGLLPDAEPPRLWRYHKPRGQVTTHKDPEGRPTVFDTLPQEIGRVISIGRLDYNTEGLMLLTNDGALARHLELPSTGWLRKYRVRAHGIISQERLAALKDGIEIDGVQYGPIEASLDSQQGANSWLTLGLREGKNREVRNILGTLGLVVNRLIRVSYGPFQLLDLKEGTVESVKRRVLEEQLGPVAAKELGVESDERDAPRPPRGAKPPGKAGSGDGKPGKGGVKGKGGGSGTGGGKRGGKR